MDKIFTDAKTLAIIVVIAILAVVCTRVVRWFIWKAFHGKDGPNKEEMTRYKFFKNAVAFIIWLVALAAIISLIPRLRALAITMFAGAGILVAIVGFAAQSAFSNIVNGIFIVLFKPFRIGDIIKVGSLDYGTVEDITLRHTVINSFQNRRIIIPNSVISNDAIINDTITDLRICRWIEIGISYDSDINKAIEIIRSEAMKHPLCIDARTPEQIESGIPQIAVRATGFGESSMNLRASVWSADSQSSVLLGSDLVIGIKNRFDKEGIEIPFPYRTLVYKKDLPPNYSSDE